MHKTAGRLILATGFLMIAAYLTWVFATTPGCKPGDGVGTAVLVVLSGVAALIAILED
jgi:hypothetical protein